MKKFSELIEEAVNCIKTYNRVIKTIDSHADDFLAAVSDIIFVATGFIKSNPNFPCSSKTPMNECSSSKYSTAASAMKISLR
jgi:hypothetical protein